MRAYVHCWFGLLSFWPSTLNSPPTYTNFLYCCILFLSWLNIITPAIALPVYPLHQYIAGSTNFPFFRLQNIHTPPTSSHPHVWLVSFYTLFLLRSCIMACSTMLCYNSSCALLWDTLLMRDTSLQLQLPCLFMNAMQCNETHHFCSHYSLFPFTCNASEKFLFFSSLFFLVLFHWCLSVHFLHCAPDFHIIYY